ncbi:MULTISPECIES: c-type cytochrome [unclassified Sphingomonas]|uniref:c-type cytochrome n=1 Tax=unclassified Sphingomonas TaxID=196159 RepID=UPI0007000844|nr:MULTISPECIES: c-type cytochrome [unclassified Sphingomonas]KQX17657.1 hypothetical protein ASD17_18180 [Sphingomonas sp. Root1294]KQY70583.1 hypothetical protein ASD39_22080 [Sphingomonas sp. Root50]KRB91927.1 hypothetical protein ASE22_08230 [Sphingomonas sp. Root720]
MRWLIVISLLALGACAGGDPHAQAKALIAGRCGACHQVPGVASATGRVGPSLSGIASQQIIAGHFRNGRDTLARWVTHPQAMLPGNAMPETGLSAAEGRAIADYLATLD